MHDDELEIDADLVRRLLAAQFPQWANLPLQPVERILDRCVSSYPSKQPS